MEATDRGRDDRDDIPAFWRLSTTGDRWAFFASAACAGLAWSCKYTTVIIPPIFAILWWLRRWRDGERGLVRIATRVAGGMLSVRCARWRSPTSRSSRRLRCSLRASARGSHPSIDGKFRTNRRHLVDGECSRPRSHKIGGVHSSSRITRLRDDELFIWRTAETGWRHYYLVATAVKVPLTVLSGPDRPLGCSRAASRLPSARDWVLPVMILAFPGDCLHWAQSATTVFRYLLPIAPLAIIWISGLAKGGRWSRRLVGARPDRSALAIASIHPYELSYFNASLAGPREAATSWPIPTSTGARVLNRWLVCKKSGPNSVI